MDIPLPPPTIIDRDVRDRNTIDLPSWNAFDGCRYRSGQQQFGKREVEKKKKREKIHGGATLDEVIYPDKFVALSNPVTR